jgi:hypothetical protein
MTDPRFTTPGSNLEELLSVVDVDELDDLGTLLTFLFDRPIDVEGVVDEDDEAVVEMAVWSGDTGLGVRRWYPMTMVDLARRCAETVNDLGPYSADESFPVEAQRDVYSMGEEELLDALMDALGKVRIFKTLTAEDA